MCWVLRSSILSTNQKTEPFFLRTGYEYKAEPNKKKPVRIEIIFKNERYLSGTGKCPYKKLILAPFFTSV